MTDSRQGSTEEAESLDERRSKVGRLIQSYELDGMAEELEERWLGSGKIQNSLRELADYFNRRLLSAAMHDAGMNPLKGEAKNTYRLLTDDVSAGVRTQTRKRLERKGIDVDQLNRDFVSHQAIHTYLTKYRGVQKESTSDMDRIKKSSQTIQQLKNRLSAVTENALETLQNTDRVTLGDFDVSVNVRVLCRDCGTQYEVRELLQSNGCDCESVSDAARN